MAASAGSRVTMSSCFGIFTIFCSIRAAAKGGTPIHGRSSSLCGYYFAVASNSATVAWKENRSAKLLGGTIGVGLADCDASASTSSSRIFDDLHPLTIAELSRFLEDTAPVLSRSKVERGVGGPLVAFAVRPYPSAGACYELELYLAVNECEGLTRGFYHYDAGAHALMPIEVRGNELDALLMRAAFAIGAPAAPQIVITIAARFGRVSWKYASIAYALILKDVGVLIQTFYMIATEMGLGGRAIGIANIDLFAKMTGIEFHVEGPVGQFAIGRSGVAPDGPDLSTLTPRVA